jgi:hypothetical protein
VSNNFVTGDQYIHGDVVIVSTTMLCLKLFVYHLLFFEKPNKGFAILFEPRCIAGYGGGFPVTDHIIGGTKHIILPTYYRKTSFLVEKFKKKCEKFPCAAASVGWGWGWGWGRQQ